MSIAKPKLAERLSNSVLRADLNKEIEELRCQEPFCKTGRNSKTLAKHDDLRIVLTVMERGARMQEHQAAGRISIQVLRGRIALHLPERDVNLSAGDLLALDQCHPHDVEAREDSAFLLSIFWPGEEKARACRIHQKGNN